MKKHVVYTLIWKHGRVYHGSTNDFKRREKEHLKTLKYGGHYNPFMKRIFSKYGKWDSVFLRTALNEKDAQRIEQELIDRDRGKSFCMNISDSARKPPTLTHDQAVAAGKKSHELGLGFHAMTREERVFLGKRGGRRAGILAVERGDGIHNMSHKQRVDNGKKYGAMAGKIANIKNRKNKTAIYGMTSDEKSAAGKLGGIKSQELGTGVHGLTLKQLGDAGKIGGRRTKDLGVGIFGLTHEQQIANGKIGGKIACHVRWHVNRGIVNPSCNLCRSS